MRRRFHTHLVVTLAVLGGGLASALVAQGSQAASSARHRASTQASAANRGQFTNKLVSYLKGKRFQVNPGYAMMYPLDACVKYTYPIMKNCFTNNPAAPYVEIVLKSWPNEYVDPATVNAVGATRHGYSAIYRLDPREAIVIYGQMPPPAKYLGLQTYEWSQPGHWKTKDYNRWARDPIRPWSMPYMFSTIPPNDRNSGRVWTFSSLGDAVNYVDMQRRSGSPFGKNRYFIITPSATTDRAVRRVLHAQGVPDRYIFTEQIPSRDSSGPIGPLGMGKRAIEFVSALRFAVPVSQDAATAWRSQLPLTVLRVRPPSSVGPLRRFGALKYGPHRAHSELYLARDLQNLVTAVCDRTRSTTHLQSTDCTQPQSASSVIPNLNDDLGWIGTYCRRIAMNCNGDNLEAAIYYSKPLPLDSGQVYAVVSTLATQTRNATYVGLGVNDTSIFAGVANVLDPMLKGSADGYAPTVQNTDKLFVHYFTRNCAALKNLLAKPDDCTEITPQMVPTRGDTTAQGDPVLHGMFQVSLRDYIVPGTARGPDSTKLLHPRLLTFFTKP